MSRSKANKGMRVRAIIIGALFFLLFSVIGAKALYLQIFQGDWLSNIAADQYERLVVATGKRGVIYDANLREMAVSIDVTSIGAHPGKISDHKKTASVLAKALSMNSRSILKKLKSKKPFVWIKRHVTPRQEKTVKNMKLKGITFVPERSRLYPNKTLAAQTIGFSGVDGHGLEGIEFYYNKVLQGVKNKITVLTDAHGRMFDNELATGLYERGNNVILTIDGNIQYITENAIETAAKKYSADSGIAIVLDPKTGAILAMAHYPFFNPNVFGNFNRSKWRNRAITDPFEPGSTMKIFSAAIAIELRVSSSNTIFFCENGTYRIGRNIVHDTKSHAWLSLQQIVKVSSNIGAVKLGEMIGPKNLYGYLRKFGFGSKSNIDCPGETSGSLMSYRRWSKIDTGAISFGQGISVSAIQLIMAAGAIANDGYLMKPYMVQAITDNNGRLIQKTKPETVRRVISATTARTVRRIMKTVTTEGGTGVNAALDGFSICGKTGTAQKINESGQYSKDQFVSSFIGFFPEKKPKVVILVALDEPKKQHYGGVVAAPAFKEIANHLITYMNISPEKQSHKITASSGKRVSG